MTDLLLHPDDSGEVTRLPGEETVRIVGETQTRMWIDTGEKTQRIDPRIVDAPSFDAIPRKVFDIDDTVIYRRDAVVYDQPPTFAVVSDPETEQLTVLGSLTADITGEFHPSAPGPQPGPLPPDPQPAPDPQPGYAGRHRLSWGGRVRRLLAGMGVVGLALAAIWAGLVIAAVAVFW
jgi:hypothetical protein